MKGFGLALLGIAMAAACVASTTPPGIGAGVDWPRHSGGDDEASYSQLDQINSANVDTLGVASWRDLPGESAVEATPLAIGGVLYFTGSYARVYAVDAVSSKLLWSYDPENWKRDPARSHTIFPVNRGVAYADGRIFFCTIDGELTALAAKTGKPLWTVQILPDKTLHSCTGAPRAFRGKVIIGSGGASLGSRGFVTARDAATGKEVWHFYTVPGSPEDNRGDPVQAMAAGTWRGEWWKLGGGGTAWDGMTFDPDYGRVYIGTGNSGPYNPEKRSPGGGDNLFLTSIVALDADTGKYLWHYQENPREAWDYKSTPNIITASLAIDGKPRKVLLHAPTNGFLYVIDRETGKPLSAGKYTRVDWADHIDIATGRPVEIPNIRWETGETVMRPGVIGGHNWQPMAFNPKTGLVYIPSIQIATRFTPLKPGQNSFHGVNFEVLKLDPDDGTGSLVAMDPVTQTPRWQVRHAGLWNGGAMTTAGNLVFQGTADGHFDAYDATSGKRLWRFNAGLGIMAQPISYSVRGRQYVSVLTGYGASAGASGPLLDMGWRYGAQPRRLLTFALGGKARPPATAPADRTVHAVDDPALVLDTADVAAGAKLSGSCMACHGMLFEASSTAPDLRESRVALDREALWSVLHDGVLMRNGMPRFEQLSRDQVRQIHAYIRARARAAMVTH